MNRDKSCPGHGKISPLPGDCVKEMMPVVLQLISMQTKLLMNIFVGKPWVIKKDQLMAFEAAPHLMACMLKGFLSP